MIVYCRLLDLRRVPPVAGRYVNMTSEIRPFASKHLNKTFFTSPGITPIWSTPTPSCRFLPLDAMRIVQSKARHTFWNKTETKHWNSFWLLSASLAYLSTCECWWGRNKP